MEGISFFTRADRPDIKKLLATLDREKLPPKTKSFVLALMAHYEAYARYLEGARSELEARERLIRAHAEEIVDKLSG